VGTLVLQLVAERRLGLDDAVERWLPGQVPNGSAITVRMLLNHSSGLFDYVNRPVLRAASQGVAPPVRSPQQLLAMGTAHKPLFAPGHGWAYSNTNYNAVGLILRKVTGLSLPQLVDQSIAHPLGLTHTYLATGPRFRGEAPTPTGTPSRATTPDRGARTRRHQRP
jgi:D-alanyl-D-alanine carboxypeptidase